VDFRLGTGRLRYTKLASQGDLAAITRKGHDSYELRIFQQGSDAFAILSPYAVTYIGQQGKRYGFIPNDEFSELAE
jgi:hypothetical protein